MRLTEIRSAVSCAIATLLILAVGASAALAQDVPSPAQNATAGAAVFGQKGCVKCHAVNGAGGSLGPDLLSATKDRTYQDLVAAMWNHLPEMTRRMDELGIERPRLSVQEAGNLFAYLYTLGFFGTQGDPAHGEELFTEKACIRCHQVAGVGGVVGPNLDHVGDRGVPIEVATAMWNHGPAMSAAARERGIPRPVLTGSEFEDIIAFLELGRESIPSASLYLLPGNPRVGAEVMVEKGCADCHGVTGRAGGQGSDLGSVARRAGLIDFVAAMWNKAPSMLAAFEARGAEFPRLESEEVANLVAYLYFADYFAGGGSASQGRTTLRAKGCLNCHGTAGGAPDLGTVSGVEDLASLTAALWNHLVAADRDPGGPSFEAWPVINGREMADILAFFQASTP